MAHDASNNNPKKEIVHALLGAVVLLVIIAGIAVSGWLRPAGNHEIATVPATAKGKALEEVLKAQEAPAQSDDAVATASASAAVATSSPEPTSATQTQ
ncbi:MAG: hypothetical protein Q4A69_04880 [Moraxella sp.]|nr:hypothetical protein [Moraxella sp.]